MAFHKKCQRYFNKRNQKIKRLLERTHAGYEEEDYHDLRLEIKKVKALVAMIAYLTGLKEKKYLKPYRRIFKMAGQVRDAQMASALLEKQRPLKWLQQYQHELKIETQLHEQEFYAAIKGASRDTLKVPRRKIAEHITEVKKGAVKKYIEQEKSAVAAIIARPRINVESAHEMRKKLKAIGYTSKLIGIKGPTESESIEEIQEALGAWHDHRQLAARLKKDAYELKDKQRRLHMQKLEKVISNKASKMFAGIRRSLRAMKSETWKSPAKGEALLL
jgi:CHAD domain-containing protein